MSDARSNIADFYKGKNIFITGGTGFMGKVLVEKLLRSCPEIDRIYLIIRPKRGHGIKARMDELFSSKIFDGVRKQRPNILDKVIGIPGDLASHNLGISPADCEILAEKISVVFHSAATVKFNESLKSSLVINVMGTKNLVQLCHKMKNLKAVVHVSTAYCNCDKEEVDELVYPPPADPDKIIKYVELADENILDAMTPLIIGNLPNTYTFTKALAEQVFVEQAEGLPAAIVRPSIVTAAWREPVKGWVDNFNGATGLLTHIGRGTLRTARCNKDLVADIVPVDIVVNLLISVGWHISTRPKKVIIYNSTSGTLNPIIWQDINNLFRLSAIEKPFSDVVWYPKCTFTNSHLISKIYVTLFHQIPAYLIDGVRRFSGKKPVMVRMQRKLQKAIETLEFFTTHGWKFNSTNVSKLCSSLSKEDRVIFNFDIRQVEWQQYMEDYVEGVRRYALKEDTKSLPAARNRIRMLFILHISAQLMMMTLAWRVFMSKSERLRKMWFSLWTITIHLARLVPAPIGNRL